MASKFTLDVKSAVGDFRKYDKATQQRFAKSLAKQANVLKGNQWTSLHKQVKNWTGRLGSSLSAKKAGKFTYEVGPDSDRVVYAWYIEAGLGTFAGYHYVRDTLKSVERRLIASLKSDIQRQV